MRAARFRCGGSLSCLRCSSECFRWGVTVSGDGAIGARVLGSTVAPQSVIQRLPARAELVGLRPTSLIGKGPVLPVRSWHNYITIQ